MSDELDVEGPAAPPRDNGELVFEAPWQGRVFAMTVALHEADRFHWEEFRRELITELGPASDATPGTYWAAWLRATETLLARRELVAGADRSARLRAYTGRSPGHDHDHGGRERGRGGGDVGLPGS